jgi:hypothetical protein
VIFDEAAPRFSRLRDARLSQPDKESHEQYCDKNDRRRVPQFSLGVEAKALRLSSDFTINIVTHGSVRHSCADSTG